MSKNLTDDQKIENKRLAGVLSEYHNELEFDLTVSEVAKILDVPETTLQYDDKGKLKISADQVANLSGKQWKELNNLKSEDWDGNLFNQLFSNEKAVMDKIAQFENQPQEEVKQAGINTEQEHSQQPNSQQQDEPEASDIIFQDSSTIVKENFIDSSIASSGVDLANFDPITEAIRREILAKQRELIASYLVEQEQDNQKRQELLNLNLANPKAYSEFAKDEENQKKILEAFKNQQLKDELEKVEIAGYKKVNKDFEKSFSPIKWDGGARIGPEKEGVTTRTQVVKSADGQEIATLTESTHQIIPPVTVKDSKGQNVELRNYRTVDFPIETENKTGPMHLSMAVKDQNGKNIALSKAVYFTAHYDDNGKLTEVSSPKPVMFSSTKPDAVGYIEHQGQIYTLPVTHENYQKMMRAIGREEEIGLSIDSPDLAKDGVMLGTGHAKKDPEVSQGKEDPKKEQQSYIGKQVDLELRKEKKYSVDEFEKSPDKGKFLEDLLGSNLSTSDKAKYLIDISKKEYTKEVIGVLASSKLDQNDKNDITGSLLRDASDLDRIKMIEELGKSNDGRKLIINAFEKGSSKERYDISNAIAESSVDKKTDLTKQILLVIARPDQESTLENIKQNDEHLVKDVERTSSDVNIESAVQTVDPKPEESKKDQEKDQQPSKADILRNSLTNLPPVRVPIKKSDKEISEIIESFSKTLDGKNLVEQKNIIDTKLDEFSKGENPLSNADKKRFLEKLLEDRAKKRGERIEQIQKGNTEIDKDDRAVRVQSATRKTDKDGFPTPIVRQFKSPQLVNRAGNVGLQAHIMGKIHELTPAKPHQTKPKDGYTLGGSGHKY